jgi:hypothetical protein
MRKFLIILLLIPILSFSQSHRKYTRVGERAFKEQDYATSTINSIKALQQKSSFKKAIELFETSIIRVNRWYEIKIEQLERESIPYKNLTSVSNTKEIISLLEILIGVQNELLFFPSNVKLSNKNYVKDNTKDYRPTINEARDRLVKYNLSAAEEIYTNSLELYSKANSKIQFQNVYKTLQNINSYVSNFKSSDSILNDSKQKGTFRVAVLEPANSSGRTTNFKVVNSVVNQVRSSLNSNTFSSPVALEYGTYYDYSKINADLVIKITFNDWGFGNNIYEREGYRNSKTNKKKDGTEETLSVSGTIIRRNNFAKFEVIVEAISTDDNSIVYTQPLSYSTSYNRCYLIGTGSNKANSSGCSLYKELPDANSMESSFKQNFLDKTIFLTKKWFN